MTKRKGAASGLRRSPEWAIVARLADGSKVYFFLDAGYRDTGGGPLPRWSSRESEAQRFCSEAEAQRLTVTMETNAHAREYLVVRLPLRRP